jgi:hypothetical protein
MPNSDIRVRLQRIKSGETDAVYETESRRKGYWRRKENMMKKTRDCCLYATQRNKTWENMTGWEGVSLVDGSPCLRKWGSCSCAWNERTDALGSSCGKSTALRRRSKSSELQLTSGRKIIRLRRNDSKGKS